MNPPAFLFHLKIEIVEELYDFGEFQIGVALACQQLRHNLAATTNRAADCYALQG